MPYTANDMRTTIFRSGGYNGAAANAPATALSVGGFLSAATHVDYFFTAELSGCSVFIDRVTAVPGARPGTPPLVAVGDLIVYHGNALSRCADAAAVRANPAASAQVPARNHMRNTLYPNAVADYNAPAPGGAGLTVQRVGLCERNVYLLTVEAEMAVRRGAGRRDVGYTCGTNVMGFRTGPAWQFWYQTWGWVTDDRHNATGAARIWDVGRIH